MAIPKMTVGGLKKFLETFDPDLEVCFLLDDARVSPHERWATDLGPILSFRTQRPKPKEVLPIDWTGAQDAIVDGGDVA